MILSRADREDFYLGFVLVMAFLVLMAAWIGECVDSSPLPEPAGLGRRQLTGRPVVASDYSPNCSLRHAEVLGELTLGAAARGVAVANLPHPLRRQLCVRVRVAPWERARAVAHRPVVSAAGYAGRPALGPVAPSGDHVLGVVAGGARDEVSRVAARRVVAAVANHQSLRYRAIGQFVGHAVGAPGDPDAVATSVEEAIAATRGMRGALPRPALPCAASVNRRPEPALVGFGHRQSHDRILPEARRT